MAVLVNILTTYNGAGAKKAMRDLAVMQKQAQLAGAGTAASLLATSARMQTSGAAIAATGALMSKRLTLSVLAFAGASVYAAQTVDKGLNRVRAGTGATGEKLKGLEESFRKVAESSGKDLETIGSTVADVNTRLGLTDQPLEHVSEQFLTLSRVTGQDVTPMLAEVAKAMNDAGVAAEDAGGFLDRLLVASQQTGIGVSELAGSMYKFGSPMRQLGFSTDHTIALLAGFNKAGVNTNLVMGSLRIALGKMAKAGEKDLPAALSKGVAAIKNAKTGGEAAAKAVELFGARAGPDMAAAIREGRFEVADLIKQLEGSGGAVQRTGDATMDFSERLGKLRNKASLAGEGFGRLLLPHLEKMVDMAGSVVAWLGRLDNGTRKWILGVGLAAAVIGPVLVVVGKLMIGVGRLVGVVGKLTMAFGRGAKAAPGWARGIAAATKGLAAFVKQAALTLAHLAKQAAAWAVQTARQVAATAATLAHSAATKASAAAQWLLNAAMSANPIGLIIIAIVALVAVIVVLWKKNETFRKVVTAAWQAIKAAAIAVFGYLKVYFGAWIASVRAIFGKISAVVSAVVGSFNRLKDGAVKALGAVINWVRSLPGRIKSAVGGLGHTLYSAGSDLLRGLWSGMQSAAGWLRDRLYSFFRDLMPGWVRKALGISSPSRLFAEIGRQLPAGMAQGISGGLGAVAAASRRMVDASLPQFGAPQGPAFAGASAGRSTIVQVARGAVQVTVTGSGSGGSVVQTDVDVAVDRAFRRLAAELNRR